MDYVSKVQSLLCQLTKMVIVIGNKPQVSRGSFIVLNCSKLKKAGSGGKKVFKYSDNITALIILCWSLRVKKEISQLTRFFFFSWSDDCTKSHTVWYKVTIKNCRILLQKIKSQLWEIKSQLCEIKGILSQCETKTVKSN